MTTKVLNLYGKLLNNCVNPKLGKHIFEAATTNRQATFAEVTS